MTEPDITRDDVVNLMTFVPAKDYGLSTRFYQDLGFRLSWQSDELEEFEIGGFAFLLQNHYVADWADNFMMHLMVGDLDTWWRRIQEQDLVGRYPGVRAIPPQDYPWGLREIHLIDPSGVLWHIAQRP